MQFRFSEIGLDIYFGISEIARNREASGERPMQSTDWPSEHSEALHDYLARDMSFSEAARALNAKFGTAYSRSAAIGRAKRMGFAGPDRPDQMSKSAPTTQSPHLERPRERHVPEPLQRIPVFERQSAAAGKTAPAPRPRVHAAGAGLEAQENAKASLCRNRSAPSLLARSRARRLPLSLWRRRGGRGHHILRSQAASGLELLRSAFSSDARPRHRLGARRRHCLAQACRGGMTRQPRNRHF
jgi:hypothetical protein